MSRCESCYCVETCTCDDDWSPLAIYDDLGTAEAHARRLARGRVVPAPCDEMASCVRSTPAGEPERFSRGGVVRYDRRSGEWLYRFAADTTSNSNAYRVEQMTGNQWVPISRGRSIEEAIAPLGGQRWWTTASPDQFRVRTPDGVIAPMGRSRPAPPGRPQREESSQHPFRPQAAGPRVSASIPVPTPVRHQRTITPSEATPVNVQKYRLSRSGQTVGEYDTAAEAQRAKVIFARFAPGTYTIGSPVRFARGERPDVQLRVRKLSADEPDELPDDDQDGAEFDMDNPGYYAPNARGGTASGDRLGRGGNYPDPTPTGRGDDSDAPPPGRPVAGGPRSPEEAQRLARFARKNNINDMTRAWGMMTGRRY